MGYKNFKLQRAFGMVFDIPLSNKTHASINIQSIIWKLKPISEKYYYCFVFLDQISIFIIESLILHIIKDPSPLQQNLEKKK